MSASVKEPEEVKEVAKDPELAKQSAISDVYYSLVELYRKVDKESLHRRVLSDEEVKEYLDVTNKLLDVVAPMLGDRDKVTLIVSNYVVELYL